jgi:hypothetical protein
MIADHLSRLVVDFNENIILIADHLSRLVVDFNKDIILIVETFLVPNFNVKLLQQQNPLDEMRFSIFLR